MSKRDLKRALRHASKENRLGAHASCEACGANDLRVLNKSRDRILCAECRLLGEEKTLFEYHHPAGRSNHGYVVRLPANEHAIMTDFQEDWPRETRVNPRGSPLRKHAALRRAGGDKSKRQVERHEEAALELELLEEFIAERLGETWPQDFNSWLTKRRT